MPETRRTTCKNCGDEFSYGTGRSERAAKTGTSLPERCPACARQVREERTSLGLAFYSPSTPVPPGISPGDLGKVEHPPRVHEVEHTEPDLAALREGCGLEDDDVLDILAELVTEQAMIVRAPTGTGKSTLLPYRLAFPPEQAYGDTIRFRVLRDYGQLVVTQPRRPAATRAAAWLGDCHNSSARGAGGDIGHAIGGDRQLDDDNVLVQVTDGWMLNRVLAGELDTRSAVIVDEAHERSLVIDLILGVLRREIARFPHLRVLIVSATIDVQAFQRFFSFTGARGVTDLGKRERRSELVRHFAKTPLGIPLRGRLSQADTAAALERTVAVATEVMSALRGGRVADRFRGDVIVFVATVTHVDHVVRRLRRAAAGAFQVLPLHGKLSDAEVERATAPRAPGGRPRVLVATNYAETSLTLKGLGQVIDSGLVLVTRWDPVTQLTKPFTEMHSQAGCLQRAGRVGRNADGEAHVVLTEEEFGELLPFTEAAVLREPHDDLIVKGLAAGLDRDDFDELHRFWGSLCDTDQQRDRLDAEYEAVWTRLGRLSVVDQDDDPTDLAHRLAITGGRAEHVRLLELADDHGCVVEAAALLAFADDRSRAGVWAPIGHLHATSRAATRAQREALWHGCSDDLDVIVKLVHLQHTLADGWHGRVGLVPKVMSEIAERQRGLLRRLAVRRKSQNLRDVDHRLVDRLRRLLSIAWHIPVHQATGRRYSAAGGGGERLTLAHTSRLAGDAPAEVLPLVLGGREITFAAAVVPAAGATRWERADTFAALADGGGGEGWLWDAEAPIGSVWTVSRTEDGLGRLARQQRDDPPVPVTRSLPLDAPRPEPAPDESPATTDEDPEPPASGSSEDAGAEDGDGGDQPGERGAGETPLVVAAGPTDGPVRVVGYERSGLVVERASERAARVLPGRPEDVPARAEVLADRYVDPDGEARWVRLLEVAGDPLPAPLDVLMEPTQLAFVGSPRVVRALQAGAVLNLRLERMVGDYPWLTRLPFREHAHRRVAGERRAAVFGRFEERVLVIGAPSQAAGECVVADLPPTGGPGHPSQQLQARGGSLFAVRVRVGSGSTLLDREVKGLDRLLDDLDGVMRGPGLLYAARPLDWSERMRLVARAPADEGWRAAAHELYVKSNTPVAAFADPALVGPWAAKYANARVAAKVTGTSKPGHPPRVFARTADGAHVELAPEVFSGDRSPEAFAVGQHLDVLVTGFRGDHLVGVLAPAPDDSAPARQGSGAFRRNDRVNVRVLRLVEDRFVLVALPGGRDGRVPIEEWSWTGEAVEPGTRVEVAVRDPGPPVVLTRKRASYKTFRCDPEWLGREIRRLRPALREIERAYDVKLVWQVDRGTVKLAGPKTGAAAAAVKALVG